jgi:hypothetical protein
MNNPPRFIIYLPSYFFRNSCCFKCNHKLIESLEIRGVDVLPFEILTGTYLYDDNIRPEVNVLYIWLTDNKYYNDRDYSQKKTELEREILLLLTGILGGSSVECDSYVNKHELFIMDQTAEAGILHESVGLKKINTDINSIKKNEMYGNTGSPMLINNDNWTTFKEKIKEYFDNIDKQTIVSYNYFINNSELVLFAFKRFTFKLSSYHYKIDEEKTCEKSIQVRSVLKGYGLSCDLESTCYYAKTHHYHIEFYTPEELKEVYDTQQLLDKNEEIRKNDIFARLRHEYEINKKMMKLTDPNWGGEEKPIYNECLKYSKQRGIEDELLQWIVINPGILNGNCHGFKSTSDVDQWLDVNIKNRHV